MAKVVNKTFEMNTFDGEVICFEFESIVVCNKNIKDALLKGYVEIKANKPYLIITNDKLNDDEVEILEDASIADALRYTRSQPAFGGLIV